MGERSRARLLFRRRRLSFWNILTILTTSTLVLLLIVNILEIRVYHPTLVSLRSEWSTSLTKKKAGIDSMFYIIRESKLSSQQFSPLKPSSSPLETEEFHLRNVEYKDILEMRKDILKENRDEFLDSILKTVLFKEVDLSVGFSKKYSKTFDKRIGGILKGIEPKFWKMEEESPLAANKMEDSSQEKISYINVSLSNRIPFERYAPDYRDIA